MALYEPFESCCDPDRDQPFWGNGSQCGVTSASSVAVVRGERARRSQIRAVPVPWQSEWSGSEQRCADPDPFASPPQRPSARKMLPESGRLSVVGSTHTSNNEEDFKSEVPGSLALPCSTAPRLHPVSGGRRREWRAKIPHLAGVV